ncbi:uracil-DNA glycosylase family protein [Shinella zoogloeoides]|uniref:uracil-DNA glycosylase family protein n=1 Tax=Shinella zoogloeoides TaxID=352475 RepID=UPI00273E097F|nr:uracil-DNA glycosylase family protein [Shinella zoogloeoides]WLR93690.1 uracil-DNA glycosylase family protein [Shinella zoogloeoides]
MNAARDLHPEQLRALLHFYADAGVDWLLEEEPVDRIAEFEAMRAARGASAPRETAPVPQQQLGRQAPARQEQPRPALPAPMPNVAIPDSQAVAEAESAAAGARTLEDLRTAMEAFNGCNLKTSARCLVFAEGNAKPSVMVVGAMPNADDDRDGLPFSGRQGAMLDRMLAGIGLARADLMLTNVVPWRPPGNRPPSQREADICRPFIERQIALAEPNHLLILGNFAARFLLRSNDTIHQLRGEWREIDVSGRKVPAFATLHPQDLMTSPISKRLAWQDLLAFRAGLGG